MARKTFAIINAADDCLHTMESAENPVDLEGLYPPGTFHIVDMDGKGDIPFKEGATIRDLTIDLATGDWVWKLDDTQIADRALAVRHEYLRNRLLTLFTAQEQAAVQGPEFAPIEVSIQDRITEIQNELGGLPT